jgi:hypothetical protein
MEHQGRIVEREIARIARGQHGVVTRAQLLGAGLTRAHVRRRIDRGSLLREYPGVYRVGHRAPSIEATYMAAVLACGKGALLSGRAAGHLLGVVKGTPAPPEVTARSERRIEGVRTRRARVSDSRDAWRWRGIPVTTVARTLVELGADLSLDALARACHEAGVLHRATPGRLTVELDSYRYHQSRHAWEIDRRREREARARGDEFRRYTRDDVFEEPALMLAELRRLLAPNDPA